MTTPHEIEEVLEQVRDALLNWYPTESLGEIAIIRGPHQWQVEERPVRKRKPVKREQGTMKAVERVG